MINIYEKEDVPLKVILPDLRLPSQKALPERMLKPPTLEMASDNDIPDMPKNDNPLESPMLKNMAATMIQTHSHKLIIHRKDEIKNYVKEKIYSDIYKTVLVDQIKQKNYDQMKEYFQGEETLLQQYEEIKDKQEKMKKKSSRNTIALFYVLSPPEDLDDRDSKILQYVDSLQNLKNIQDRNLCSIEWRAHNPPSGMHANILIFLDKANKNGNIKNQLETRYKKIFNVKSTSISFNLSCCETYNHVKNTIQYIIGNKIDTDKQIMVEQDRRIRDLYKIPQYIDNLNEEDVVIYKPN